MAVKSILIEPNKLLRQVSKAVEKVGKEEKKLMDDMFDTMYAENGIGLAAIQIGVPKRIIVMDLSKDPEKKEKSDRQVCDHRSKNKFNKRTYCIPTERAFLKRGTPTANIHCTTLRRTKKRKRHTNTSQHKSDKI